MLLGEYNIVPKDFWFKEGAADPAIIDYLRRNNSIIVTNNRKDFDVKKVRQSLEQSHKKMFQFCFQARRKKSNTDIKENSNLPY